MPIYQPYIEDYSHRYNVYWGGRGSGKTKFVMQKLLVKGLKEKRMILLMRKETNKLRDSVWKELLEVLDDFKLTPYFDMDKKIISIDGGNNMKSFGQLNALIIENFESGLTFTYRYATHFPQKLIKNTQKGNEEDAKIIAWPNYDVKMLSENKEESLVLNKNSDYLKVKTAFLKRMNDKWSVIDDYTNYVHEIKKPVLADIVYEDETSYLANVDGILGWIYK